MRRPAVSPARARKRRQTKLDDDQVDVLVAAYEDGLSFKDLASEFPSTAGQAATTSSDEASLSAAES